MTVSLAPSDKLKNYILEGVRRMKQLREEESQNASADSLLRLIDEAAGRMTQLADQPA
jgi:hypothetical protein